jgi:hypothetical protein
MKYGTTNTFKGKRRFGRHGSGGHKPNKSGSNKGSFTAAPKPSLTRYFSECRWLANKARRIARAAKACR